MVNPSIPPTIGSDVETNANSNGDFDDSTTLQDKPFMDRSYPQTAFTSLPQTRLHSSIDKPLDNSDPRLLALPQTVALDSFTLRPPLFTVAQPGLDECHALHTSPQTMSFA
jgi:hypothetical protein